MRGAYRKLALKVHPDKQKDKDSVEMYLGAGGKRDGPPFIAKSVEGHFLMQTNHAVKTYETVDIL